MLFPLARLLATGGFLGRHRQRGLFFIRVIVLATTTIIGVEVIGVIIVVDIITIAIDFVG